MFGPMVRVGGCDVIHPLPIRASIQASKHPGSHGREPQPQSHLPSLCKATLIFPWGATDDASWLRAFCRLHTASLEWIRRFQESNYQLAHPEPGRQQEWTVAPKEKRRITAMLSLWQEHSVPFAGSDSRGSLSTLNTMTQSGKNVHKKLLTLSQAQSRAVFVQNVFLQSRASHRIVS